MADDRVFIAGIIKRAALYSPPDKAFHLILVQIHIAGVAFPVIVITVMHAVVTIDGLVGFSGFFDHRHSDISPPPDYL